MISQENDDEASAPIATAYAQAYLVNYIGPLVNV